MQIIFKHEDGHEFRLGIPAIFVPERNANNTLNGVIFSRLKRKNMNAFAPISSIMSTDLVTVNPEDNLLTIKKVFESHTFHHLPVVRFRKIVGIISKTDFEHFTGGLSHFGEDRFVNESRLERTKAEDIMTHGIGKLEPDDRINVALEIFSKNWFHALPVVKNDELVGIVTTQDLIKVLLNEKPKEPHMVYENLE